MNPITGQGGNNAIESATALANNLVRRLDVVCGPLSNAEIDGIFSETQAVRQDRARLSVDTAYKVQKVEAMESPMAGILVRLMLPLLSRDMLLERQSGIIVESVRVEKLPVPERAHFVPYVDELPANPMTNARLPKLATALCLLGLFYIAIDAQRLPNLQTVTETYNRNWALNNMLVDFKGILSAPVISEDLNQHIHSVYFMAMLIPAILIWTIEGHRRGNNETILGRLIIW